MVFVVCVWENKIGRPAQLDKIPGIGTRKKGKRLHLPLRSDYKKLKFD
jgi:hypothetical protein